MLTESAWYRDLIPANFEILSRPLSNSFQEKVVLKVKEINTGDNFLLKIINTSLSDLTKRTENEFNTLRYIQNKSCIFFPKAIFCTVDTTNRFRIYQYEYIENTENLSNSDFLQTFDENDFIFLCQSILNALEDLHSNRIIHGDLSGKNILRKNNSNSIYLIDFEESEILLGNSTTVYRQKPRGTAGFIAPETYSTFGYSFKTDVYSVGKVLTALVSDNNLKLQKSLKNKLLDIFSLMSRECPDDRISAIEVLSNLEKLEASLRTNRFGFKSLLVIPILAFLITAYFILRTDLTLIQNANKQSNGVKVSKRLPRIQKKVSDHKLLKSDKANSISSVEVKKDRKTSTNRPPLKPIARVLDIKESKNSIQEKEHQIIRQEEKSRYEINLYNPKSTLINSPSIEIKSQKEIDVYSNLPTGKKELSLEHLKFLKNLDCMHTHDFCSSEIKKQHFINDYKKNIDENIVHFAPSQFGQR